MRCPACGARNPESAEWCTQCFAPLRTEPEPALPETLRPDTSQPGTPRPEASSAAPHGPPSPSGPSVEEPVDTADGRFRRTDEGLDWRCQVCGEWNPIERSTCHICGAGFGRGLEEPDDGLRDVSESTVLVASAAVPGLGHILMGRPTTGAARLATWLLWLVGGLWLMFEARGAGGSVVPSLPLLLGAVVIWVLSPVDAVLALRGSDQELLRPRVFLWLVVGVIALLLMTFLASAVTLPDTLG